MRVNVYFVNNVRTSIGRKTESRTNMMQGRPLTALGSDYTLRANPSFCRVQAYRLGHMETGKLFAWHCAKAETEPVTRQIAAT